MEESHITLKIVDKSGSTLSETTCELTEKNLTCLIAGLKKVQAEVNDQLTRLVENTENDSLTSGRNDGAEDDDEDDDSDDEKELPCVKKLKTS